MEASSFEYSRADAVTMLIAIKQQLLPKLAAEGYRAALDKNEQLALRQFKKLSLEKHDWLADRTVTREAGLSPSEMHLLSGALAHHQAERMREQHRNREGLGQER